MSVGKKKKKKKSQTSFQVGEQCLSPPQLCHFSQGTSLVDEGYCHVHLPLSGLAPPFCPPPVACVDIEIGLLSLNVLPSSPFPSKQPAMDS